jgi:DNA-binding NtrC family response regulator
MDNTPPPTIRIRILVVDDEKDISDLLVRHLTFLGHDVVGVYDPVAAMRMVEEENIHVVISDIVMPGMDGLELLRRIKAYNGGIQVIMVTGYVTMHHILTAMRLGAETVFFKPLQDLDHLEKAVEHCIRRVEMWRSILRELGALGKASRGYGRI